MTLVGACGGGGGGSGSPPAAAQIATVEAPSQHRLLVTFDEPPGDQALDPANYLILDTAGNALDILGVSALGADANPVLIATALQQADGYRVIYPAAAGEAPGPREGTAFTGSIVPEPELLEVEVIDLQHLRLTFSGPMGGQAEDPAFYTIFDPAQAAGAPTNGGQLTAARRAFSARAVAVDARVSAHRTAMAVATDTSASPKILTAAFGDATSTVVLTTTTLAEPLDYILIVGDLRDQNGIYLDPTRNTAGFNSDVTPPRLVSAEPQGPTSLLLTFSEPLGPSAEEAANYALSPDTAVLGALLVGDGSQAILNVEPLFDEQYTIELSNIRGLRNGLLVDPTARILSFAGTGAVDEESPRLLAAVSDDPESVLVQFSKAMGDSALNPAAYNIATTEPGGDPLQVLGAEFLDVGRLAVVLTTSPQEALPYQITVIGVTDLGGRPLASDSPDVEANRALFQGTAPPASEDVIPPRLLAAQPQGDNGLLLTFSEAVSATADAIVNYALSPATNVLSAQRLAGNTQVLLETGLLFAVEYQLTASNIEDLNGLLIDPAGKTVSFIGAGAVNEERPRVISAKSDGNTVVRVNFSKPMADNAADPAAYAIVQQNVNSEVGVLAVLSAAFVGDQRLVVELTTRSQNEVTYQVTVTGVTDLAGQPLAAKEPFGVDPTSATFAGTPPTDTELVDADGDGLPDNVETLGYVVEVRLANGETRTRQVTGSPDSADSDGDGLDDFVEKRLGIDPRTADTDADDLTDFVEFNEIFSDPANQDSDSDGIGDGLEHKFFFTSALLVDSDGDQRTDGDEINLATRNPRVADIPQPGMQIGAMDLRLDVRFIETNSSGSRELDTETVMSTLTQSQSQEFSNSASQTIDASYKTYASNTTSVMVGFSAGFPPTDVASTDVSTSFTTGFEASAGYSQTTNWSETSKQMTEEAHQESQSTEAEVTEGSTLSRQIDGAVVQVAVTLRNLGDVAFTIRNLQITALMQNPQDPGELIPIATLLPVQGAASQFNLGTLGKTVGPLLFANDQIFPLLVEKLMDNPRGLVFRFSNYDITDEFGRNFAFTSQDITDRTATLVLDFGGADDDGNGVGDLAETYRVATGSGRRVDTDGDGDIDDNDRRIVFDGVGRQIGITLADALAALGLTRYDENATATATLTTDQIENSYSIQTAEGLTRIFRVRSTQIRVGDASEWRVVTPTGINRLVALDEVILQSGGGALLAFVEDLDQDNLPAVLEAVHGCSDTNPDTDGDGLDDRYETLIGWRVRTEGGGERLVRPTCRKSDTDGDGRSDLEEAPGDITFTDSGLVLIDEQQPDKLPQRDTTGVPADADPIAFALADPITDPRSADTDSDALGDDTELDGYAVCLLVDAPCPPAATTTFVTSPEHRDTDGDTATDGLEQQLGGNPRVPDADLGFGDRDGDGLLDIQEINGWTITYEGVSGGPNFATICDPSGCSPGSPSGAIVTSNPDLPDTDGDSLTDLQEFQLGTAPVSTPFVNGPDTDEDGLGDAEEFLGFATPDFGILITDPRDRDSDDDKRYDGAEIGRLPPAGSSGAATPSGRRHVVEVPGQAPFQAFSNPNVPDADQDGLLDGDEVAFGGDPNNFDTDGHHLADRDEATRGSRVNVPDYLVTVFFTNFFTPEDGDAGSSAGEWTWDIGVRLAGGGLAPRRLRSADVPPEKLEDCEDEGTDHLCRSDRFDEDAPIKFESKFLPRLDFGPFGVPIGSVSATDALFEQFQIVGSFLELDGDVDCEFEFPDFNASSPDTTGVFDGSSLMLGNTTWKSNRVSRGVISEEPCEMELQGFIQAR